MLRLRVLLVAALLCLLFFAGQVPGAAGAATPTPNAVRLESGRLLVDGAPLQIKGIAYSPVPMGESVHVEGGPQGDYFTPDYAYIWSRDLPAIAAAGFNTLRLYGWTEGVDHSAFLDACSANGLKVLLTYYVAPLKADAVFDAAAQKQVTDKFATEVARYGDHPAILMWSFGNELNGVWMNYKSVFDRMQCAGAWVAQGCENKVPEASGPGSPCFVPTTCMYEAMFTFFNDALVAAKKHTTRPMTVALADVDYLISGNPATDKIPRFQAKLPQMDIFAIQLYRGGTFGSFFSDFAAESSKPLLIAEYGVDAFNDACGWKENEFVQPCQNYFNQPNAPGGADASESFVGCKDPASASDPCQFPGVKTQAEWDTKLTNEVLAAPSNVGGVVMSWHDENWKNVDTQDKCSKPCQTADGNPSTAQCLTEGTKWFADYAKPNQGAGCTYKAHITCSNYDMQQHDICGYFLWSAPDRYVNEAWFGMNGVNDCGASFTDQYGGHRLSALSPRPALQALSGVFGGKGGAGAQARSCADMANCYRCTRHYWNIETHTAPGVLAGFCDEYCPGLKFTGSGYVDLNAADAPKPWTPSDTDDGTDGGDGGDGNNKPGGTSAAPATIGAPSMLLAALALAAALTL